MLTFKQIYESDTELTACLTPLWLAYMREISASDESFANKSDEEITVWLTKRVRIQGKREKMHFECVFEADRLIGFIFYAVDLGGIKGILEAGYGYIMEMYVIPECRRKAFGSRIYEHAEQVLRADGAESFYLTPDSKSGIPFWFKLGFRDSGKTDPDNKMPIYIK